MLYRRRPGGQSSLGYAAGNSGGQNQLDSASQRHQTARTTASNEHFTNPRRKPENPHSRRGNNDLTVTIRPFGDQRQYALKPPHRPISPRIAMSCSDHIRGFLTRRKPEPW